MVVVVVVVSSWRWRKHVKRFFKTWKKNLAVQNIKTAWLLGDGTIPLSPPKKIETKRNKPLDFFNTFPTLPFSVIFFVVSSADRFCLSSVQWSFSSPFPPSVTFRLFFAWNSRLASGIWETTRPSATPSTGVSTPFWDTWGHKKPTTPTHGWYYTWSYINYPCRWW